jgi:indolepyruvate ferredoxin oxidoreductase
MSVAVDYDFSLSDALTRERGRLYMSGIQALVRLPIMQRRFDRARGLNTAGLISGYRGSPLGGYDLELWRCAEQLTANDILFQPGLNEDLAATAIWGSQMHAAFGKTKVDGVFGIWYGKGPGVDRTGDAFRNANMLGTSALGGVLAVSGDDHTAQSSTFPHQSDGIFHAVMMPVLQPASVAEILALGMAGFELSRFSGLWVAMKTIAEVVESAGSFDAPEPFPQFVRPSDFVVPAHGLNWDPRLAWPAQRAELERRVIEERLPAAKAWARANRLDRVLISGPGRRIGIVTVGKAHQDLMEAFARLNIDPARARELGLSLYKIALAWPVEPEGLIAFAEGLDEIFVIEEKRGFVEDQIKQILYHMPAQRRPRVTGKTDETGVPLLPEFGDLSQLIVARALLARLKTTSDDLADDLLERLTLLETKSRPPEQKGVIARTPFFCAGCPHNTSTKVPDGSSAGGGIGCHTMALSQPERRTTTFSQMGGEGVQWVGASPFVEQEHLFQNLGDGTYQHSGLLAIRAAVTAGTNITFKILYNDAVAMTGGQPPEGKPSPARIAQELMAEGLERVFLLSDKPERWTNAGVPLDVAIRHRDEMDLVQRELRGVPGVTAIIYEQTCAAELRRRRKRGETPDPDHRLFINSRVCEACGDCEVQSNCIAVEPVETEYGRKRRINQNVCNKDFSCVKGFCPSFVEVEGVALKKPDAAALKRQEATLFARLPEPQIPLLGESYNVYVAGIGGTGVLTLGALLAVAAHIEGKASSVLDFSGLSQKNGAVTSQVRLAASPEMLHAGAIGPGETDLLLGADMVVSSARDALTKLSPEMSTVVLNLDEVPTAAAVLDRDAPFPARAMQGAVAKRAARTLTLRTGPLAQALFGDTVTANTMLLGFAWQKGLIPLSSQSLLRAIALNGVAVETNTRAFTWGRALAHDQAAVETLAGLRPPGTDLPKSLDELIARRVADLTAYQDSAYAERYRRLVETARSAEKGWGASDLLFTEAVATFGYKLMAYKDEYEVARLYTDGAFDAELRAQVSRADRVSLWLAPPIFAKLDPATGRPKKKKYGRTMLTMLRWLARFKFLRGTALDPFGGTEERKTERRLIGDYERLIARLVAEASLPTRDIAIALVRVPDEIRGYGVIKNAAIVKAEARKAKLLQDFDAALTHPTVQAAE